jgi:gamma-glutamyltranspeptidase / glutathione hydrolase
VLAASPQGKRSKPMPGHSDAIVAIDQYGNVATVVHTINTVIWGDTGIVVGGVPISDVGGFGPEQFASKEPGDRISDGMQSTIAMADGKPILATAAVGCSGVAETVRMLLGIIGNRLEPQSVRVAPPLLFDWGEFSSDAPSGRTDRLIPDGMYAPEFLRRVEQACGRLRRIPYGQTEGIRGTVVLSAIDPKTEIRRAFETRDVFGIAAAC